MAAGLGASEGGCTSEGITYHYDGHLEKEGTPRGLRIDYRNRKYEFCFIIHDVPFTVQHEYIPCFSHPLLSCIIQAPALTFPLLSVRTKIHPPPLVFD